MSRLKKKHKIIGLDTGLDNKAPVEEIAQEAQQKNINAHRMYVKCVGRRAKRICGDHWTLVGHPINKFPDHWNGEVGYEYFDQFHFKSILPKFISPIKNIEKIDPVSEYMKIKDKWLYEVNKLSSKSEPFLKNIEELNDEVVYCPKSFVNLAALYKRDPDPNFNSYYNWYYTGNGNLQLVTLNYVDYLLHSDFHVLYLSEFNKEELKILPKNILTFDCGEGNNILETISDNILVILRTMYRIYILKINETDNEISIEKIKEIHSNVAFLSINFDVYHKNILYLTKLDNNLIIVNTDRMKGKFIKLQEPKTLIDNWNSVLSIDRYSYYHFTSDGVALYDKRTNTSSSVLTGLLNNHMDFSCNKICSAQLFNECLYLGTTHHIFSLDVRLTSNFKSNILQRWTHNMKLAPTYMSIRLYEMGKDLICASSQWCEDMCLFISDSNNVINGREVSGVSVPYRPPSILNTLQEAKYSMMCNDLYNSIDDRVMTSISGTLLLEQDEKYIVLMLNSLGDISCHTLYPEHLDLFAHDDSVEKLKEWSKDYKVDTKLFTVSNLLNISKLLNKLKKVPLDSKFMNAVSVDNTKYSSKEVVETFQSETVDSGLLDAWGVTDVEMLEQSLVNDGS